MKVLRSFLVILVIATALPACRRTATVAAPAAEPPTLDVTNWTDKSELFMEYPPLVAGHSARYAVHLTRLSNFTPMTNGRPRIEFTPESGGSPIVIQGNPPSRPGAFRVEGNSPSAGTYKWALIVDAPELQDRHDLGTITVFADEKSAVTDAELRAAHDAAAISYLKEPQWTNGFGTVPAQEAEIRRSIRVPAIIEPLAGGEAVVSAPADGRFVARALLTIGDRVTAGQEIGAIQPRLSEGVADRAALVASEAEAESSVDAAKAELARAERLLNERAVPARRVEDAQRALKVAEARLSAARARLAQRDETLRTGGGAAGGNAFVLRAPISGRIAEVMAAQGASFSEGAALFRIVRTDRVELEVHVPASDAPLQAAVSDIALEIPGRPDAIPLKANHQHDAGVIDPKTRALPVKFDLDNRGGQLLIGQIGTAVIYTGGKQRMLVVPKAAVLTEGGRPYVFVQIGGESFSRRFIDIAARDGDQIGIRSGITSGERVVTRGAYDVQLASAASGLPAEGHVH